MDDRIRALVDSDDWLVPPWPELKHRPMTAFDFVKHPKVQLGDIDEALPDRVGAFFKKSGNMDEAIKATEEAVAGYRVDRAQGWDWEKNERKRDREKPAEQFWHALRDLLRAYWGLTDSQRGALNIRGFGPLDLEKIEDLARLDVGDGDLGYLDDALNIPKKQNVSVSRLAFRLRLVWDALEGAPPEVTDWGYSEFVSTILRAVTGHDGDRYARKVSKFMASRTNAATPTA